MSWFNDVASAVLSLSGKSNAATSNWGSIHPDLIAEFVQVDTVGNETGVAFKALIKEGNIEQSFQWVSPFENMTVESFKMSALGMAQSGGIERVAQLLGAADENITAKLDVGTPDLISKSATGLKAFSDKVAGRSGITKANSTQVYSGHAPLKLDMTLVFRAWQDPQSEVIAPFTALQQMAYPNKMASSVADVLVGQGTDSIDNLTLLFPSEAPKLVSLTYKGETYPPLVIESIGKPLDAPYSPMGDIWLEVPVSLHSFQSIDFESIRNAKIGAMGKYLTDTINKATSLFKPANSRDFENLF